MSFAVEHEDRVVGADTRPLQRGDRAVDASVELAVGQRTTPLGHRHPSGIASGGVAHEVDRLGAPVPGGAKACGACRHPRRRVADQVVTALHAGSFTSMMARERQTRIRRAMLRSARMQGIPPYPPTIWALVEQAAEQWSDHVVLADDHGRSLTGRQLHDAAAATAAALATHGVTAGTIVSWQLPTTLETTVVMTALARLGAIQNPLIPILREREVGFITNQVGTEVFITTERWRGFEHGELARSLAADQGFTVVLTDLDTDPTTIGNTLRLPEGDATTLPAAPSLDDAPMRWIYTSSGTTADPKGVRHTDRSVMHGATGPIGTGASPDDVNAVAVPVSHIGGMLMLTAALMTGMRLVLFESFDPATSPERFAAHGATVLGSAVPFFLAYFDAQQRHGDDPLFPRLRMLTGGGAATPPEISRRAREVLGVRGIANSWGLTEFPVATYGRLDVPLEVLDTTTGPAVAGVEVRSGDRRRARGVAG